MESVNHVLIGNDQNVNELQFELTSEAERQMTEIKTANRSQAKISEHVSDNITKIQTYSGYMVK